MFDDDSPILNNPQVDDDSPILNNPGVDPDSPIFTSPNLDPDAPILNNPVLTNPFGRDDDLSGDDDDDDDGPPTVFPDFLDVPIFFDDIVPADPLELDTIVFDSIDAAADADLFSTASVRGVTYLIDVIGLDGGLDPIASVLDSEGEVLQTDPGDASLMRSTQFFTATGEEFLTAVGGFFESTGDYQITIEEAFVDGIAVTDFPEVQGLSTNDLMALAAQQMPLDADAPPPGSNAYEDAITLIYEAALGRSPEAEGLDYWVEQALAGAELADIAESFIESPEFTERFGDIDFLGGEDYTRALYENVLDRPADADGLAFWLDELARPEVDRVDLLVEFALSDENVDAASVRYEADALELLF